MINSIPTVPIDSIPQISTEQMIEVDRAMIEDFHITLVQMMENAGRGLARLTMLKYLQSSPTGKQITVLAGRGGNGGGALVAARRLHTWGANVEVALTKPIAAFEGISGHQLSSVRQLGIVIHVESMPENVDVILDGLIGYSLKGAPRGRAADLIRWTRKQDAPILSLDTPSGVDMASGRVFDPSIYASATLTLALPKSGLLSPEATPHVGKLYLADISVPPSLYAEMGLKVSSGLFAKGDIVRLT